ncbi:hypothetical protein [Pseudomonas typographi]|uniref:hypothetical protein n=1 Tax=Pseudomonas typographi TaxID=2715964 RepID=UPI001687437F|nr:hypothetical protein [Pseudomonas typographi]MBD1589866.1 hypothetical protein [Pseudomonas typographi]
MDEIKSALLYSYKSEIKTPDSLAACLNAHGLYNIGQFVLRLSPINHALVDNATTKKAEDITWDEIQAYSTYIHETVHWWQHIGSTSGLISSMCFPAQTHVNVGHLRDIVKCGEFGKSLKEWSDDQMLQGRTAEEEVIARANITVNNTLDLDYYRAIIMNPRILLEIVKENHFESVGHTFYIAYSCCLDVLTTTFNEVTCLPDTDLWREPIEHLKLSKAGNYHWRSDVYLPPITGVDVLEGQARFIQLQFLHFSNPSKSFADYGARGYLDSVYGAAFKYFIQSTDSNFPDCIDDPLVALFLLVCDLALNPGEGFPFEIKDYENFSYQAQPAVRFAYLCQAIKNEHPELKDYIKEYSKEEYTSASALLAKACGYHHPLDVARAVSEWVKKEPTLQALMTEHSKFSFSEMNLPVRVIFSEFIKFNTFKLEQPEFFCWTGRHKVGRYAEHYIHAWLKNLSLYSDKQDDFGIYPRRQEGKSEENIHNTFNIFYGYLMQYDLIRQWIIQSGEFKYDFSWLSEKHEPSEVKEKVKEVFTNLFGVSPDEIEGAGWVKSIDSNYQS